MVSRTWIRDWFQKADKNKDGRMNFKEVQHLLKMMNVDMNEDHALRLFQVSITPQGVEGLGWDWRGWNKLRNTALQKVRITFFCLSLIHLITHPSINLFTQLPVYPNKNPFVHLC